MPRYALLLRGVNVGGHRRLPMKDLQKMLQELGFDGVSTYLQSGNAVVASEADADTVAARVERGLAERLGVETDVLVRSGAELADVITANPFRDAVSTPTLLHVAFLSGQPDPERWQALDPETFAPDAFRLGDRAVYLRFAVSAGRSAMPAAVVGRLGVVATSRNWNTIQELATRTA